MTSFPEDHPLSDRNASTSSGKLLAEFGDFRAGILTKIGYTFGALGIVLLSGGILRLPPRFLFNDITPGLFMVIFGTVFFAVGKFRHKNRLVIYQDGIVQIKWGRVDALLWRDIREIYVQCVTSYGSGLAYKVRYHCSLQRGDKTWLALNAIPITAQVMKSLRESATLANSAHKGNLQDFQA